MARKSIIHPNQTDVAVLDSILSLNKTEIRASEVVSAFVVSQGLSDADGVKDYLKTHEGTRTKSAITGAFKYLTNELKLVSEGKGRGTFYRLLTTENDLVVANPSNLSPVNYRNPGGPTVSQIVRAVFNSLNPNDKISPKEVQQKAAKFFPDQNLTRNSFGQIFPKMHIAGELFASGNGRAKQYWRGTEKLEGAIDIPTKTFEDNNDIFEDVFEDNALMTDFSEDVG